MTRLDQAIGIIGRHDAAGHKLFLKTGWFQSFSSEITYFYLSAQYLMFSDYLYHYFMNNKNWHKLSHAHLLLRALLTSVQRLRLGGVALQRIQFEVGLVFLANASIYFEMISDWSVVVSTWNKSFLRPYIRKSHWNITICYVYSIWFGWYRIWFDWAVYCNITLSIIPN